MLRVSCRQHSTLATARALLAPSVARGSLDKLASTAVLALAAVAATARHGALAGAAAPARLGALRDAATAAFTSLLTWYNATTGEFGPASTIPFWTSHCSLSNVAAVGALAADARAAGVLSTSFAALVPTYTTPKVLNDDIQWAAQAWMDAYVFTGDAKYLDEARHIYEDLLLDPKSPWKAWNATCGGFNWWSTDPYVNTITNALAFTGLVRLQRLTGSTARVHGRSLLEWAGAVWAWAQRPGLRTGDGVFLDGVAGDCATPVGSAWTYNSGVWLDGLTGLSVATGNASYSDAAFDLARAAAAHFAGGHPDGVMRELGCGADGACGGPDGREFKGAFARRLSHAWADWAAPGTAASNAAAAAWARAWAAAHSSAVQTLDASTLPGSPPTPVYGQLWQGPFAVDSSPWVSHSAGWDVVLADLRTAAAAP